MKIRRTADAGETEDAGAQFYDNYLNILSKERDKGMDTYT